ncbi:MAG: hypothetical protein ACPF8V_01895 [Luteibaculum sp.]
MASKRDVKRYFKEELNRFADDAYDMFLSSTGEKKQKADQLLSEAADVLDQFILQCSSYPRLNKEATKKYFSNLKTDFDEHVEGLYHKLNKI